MSVPPDRVPMSFVDSLQAMVGGGVRVRPESKLLAVQNFLRQLFGQDPRAGQAIPRNIVMLEGTPESNRQTTQHEFGHIADFRNILGKEGSEALRLMTPEGGDPAEFFADVFMTSVDLLQQIAENTNPAATLSVMKMIDADPVMGEAVRSMIRHLLQQEVFADHPLNQALSGQNSQSAPRGSRGQRTGSGSLQARKSILPGPS